MLHIYTFQYMMLQRLCAAYLNFAIYDVEKIMWCSSTLQYKMLQTLCVAPLYIEIYFEGIHKNEKLY